MVNGVYALTLIALAVVVGCTEEESPGLRRYTFTNATGGTSSMDAYWQESFPQCEAIQVTQRLWNVTVGKLWKRTHKVVQYLQAQKMANPNFKVLDVGGSYVGWSAPVVDFLMDKHPPTKGQSNVTIFQVNNVNDADDWAPVLEHVQLHGQFDFCICSHTLEDLALPYFVVKQISRVAKAGWFATPSKYRELHRFEQVPGSAERYRGYMHHRWVYTITNGAWTAFPKVAFVERWRYFDFLTNPRLSYAFPELSFYWEGPISLLSINEDFLGPTAVAIRNHYKKGLTNDDVDRTLKCNDHQHRRKSSIQLITSYS